jgi:protein JSN1
MLEKLSPHVAMIGIHKNGTWAAQKIIECVQTPEEVAIVAQNLRPYGPPLLLDQFGNYVVQYVVFLSSGGYVLICRRCCLRFGPPANDFIFDAMVDRLWEIAQGRFGARSMRACLESSQITVNQQRRVATAIVLNSIPLATNPNGALLLTWLLDTSGFPSRYILLAPRFSPHLSHLCTHKLASLTVLRIVNQKVEPAASLQVVEALFTSPGDHVLTDVLGDQVNGVAVVHKILTSPFLDPDQRPNYIEATKRVIIELKVVATQAYRRLVEEVGLPIPAYNAPYPTNGAGTPTNKGPKMQQGGHIPGLPSGYSSSGDGLASMMAQLQMGGQNPQAGPPQLQLHLQAQAQAQAQAQGHGPPTPHRTRGPPHPSAAFSPSTDPFNPFGLRSPEISSPRPPPLMHRTSSGGTMAPPPGLMASAPSFGGQNPLGMDPQAYAAGMASPQQAPMSPHLYQAYMYQMYQQNQSMGAYQQS